MDSSAPPAPRHAATVLVLRERDHALETLMLLRHTALKFMAGAWVFPGGGLSPHDYAPATLARLRNAPDAAHGFRDKDFAPLRQDLARGLYVCAFRETFEEAGVLVAQHANGTPCAPDLVARLQAERAASDHDASLFPRMLEREHLYLDASKLQYWSHWITPSALGPTRFDTRFFVVALPSEQDIGALSRESDRAAWLRLRDVQEMITRGDMHVSPPTVSTFEDAHRCYERAGSLTGMLAQERRREVFPILPKHIRTEHGMAVVMPWDPEYAAAAGEGTPLATAPAYLASQPSRRTLNR